MARRFIRATSDSGVARSTPQGRLSSREVERSAQGRLDLSHACGADRAEVDTDVLRAHGAEIVAQHVAREFRAGLSWVERNERVGGTFAFRGCDPRDDRLSQTNVDAVPRDDQSRTAAKTWQARLMDVAADHRATERRARIDASMAASHSSFSTSRGGSSA